MASNILLPLYALLLGFEMLASDNKGLLSGNPGNLASKGHSHCEHPGKKKSIRYRGWCLQGCSAQALLENRTTEVFCRLLT